MPCRGRSVQLVLVDPELAALVRGIGPVNDCLAARPRAVPGARGHLRLVTGLLAVSVAANAALIGVAWTDRGRSAATAPMAPVPTLSSGLPATGIGVAAKSDGARCTGTSGFRLAQPSATEAPSGTGRTLTCDSSYRDRGCGACNGRTAAP